MLLFKLITHILLTIFWSFISTALPIPVSPSVVHFAATINKYNPLITIGVAVLTDTIVGYFVYKLFLTFNYEKFAKHTDKLLKLGTIGFMMKLYIDVTIIGILEDEKTQKYISKYGIIALFLAAATPLPFTAVIYASGIVKYERPKTLIMIVFIGRIINYTLMYLVNLGILSI